MEFHIVQIIYFDPMRFLPQKGFLNLMGTLVKAAPWLDR
jgi:hypothetical protein